MIDKLATTLPLCA